jgi:hypothetical protein
MTLVPIDVCNCSGNFEGKLTKFYAVIVCIVLHKPLNFREAGLKTISVW